MKLFVVVLGFSFLSFVAGNYWGIYTTGLKFEVANPIKPVIKKEKPRVWT